VPQFTWVFVTEWTTHGFRQSSITAQIPGKSNKTIVIGAHQDSSNVAHGADPTTARAPGAGMSYAINLLEPFTDYVMPEDNGSSSMTILEAFRTVLLNDTVADNEAEHTIEFHWCAAEEVGLLGFGHVFRSYAEEGVDVVAMLNQDMTGYTSHNMTPKSGIVMDRLDPALTNFIRLIIDAYTDTEAADTQCGYGCSITILLRERAIRVPSFLKRWARGTVFRISILLRIQLRRLTLGM
jgi:leucyl aminopeptidase